MKTHTRLSGERVVEVHAEATGNYYRMIATGDRGTRHKMMNLYNTAEQVHRQARYVIGLAMR